MPRTLPPGSLTCMSATQTLQRWICESCGYIYDPEEGDPDGGIPAGTAFEDIPDTWFCPVCGDRKRDFTLYEDLAERLGGTARLRPRARVASLWGAAGGERTAAGRLRARCAPALG